MMKGFTPLQILKGFLFTVCNLRRKDSLITCNTTKKFLTGLTFVEVIIAMLLINVIALGMLGAYSIAKNVFTHGRHRLQAYNFARKALDALRANYNYDSNPQMTPGTDKAESNIGDILTGELETNFNAALTYDVIAEPSTGSYKEVVAEVTWNEP